MFKPLREIVTFKGGGTPSKAVAEYWNGNIPWATVKDFTATTLSKTQESITDAGLQNSSANLIPRGHVIIPTRMSLGKAAINDVDLAINQDLRALMPKVPVDADYLLHAVLSLKDVIVRKGSGATVKGITQEELYDLEIFFPPLESQIRIAHLLGKVERLVVQRKRHLQQLDDLTKSLFLEMFGNPVRNERGWPTEALGKLARIERGRFSPRPRNDPKYYGGNYPFIQTGDITRSKGRLREYTQTLNDLGTTVSKEFFINTIVIAIVGATIGETAILEISTYAPDSVIGITPFSLNRNEVVFIEYVLRFWKPVLRAQAPDAARANINIETLRPMRIIKPPERYKFSELMSKLERLNGAVQKSLADLEILYGALSQKAFKGELVLSRVPATPTEGEQLVTVVPSTPHTVAPAINLPDTDVLVEVLKNREYLKEPLQHWLEAYRGQLGEASFSVERFMAAAQARLAELHPDNTFELGADDYEHIKCWVFEALAAGNLRQAYDDEDNRIRLMDALA
jgi:type I restriction enzyme S subunit